MILLDSSIWLEYINGEENAHLYDGVINDKDNIIIPTMVLFEVTRNLLKVTDEEKTTDILSAMMQSECIDQDAEISILGAFFSHEYKLPSADSLIYATAQKHKATLWTQDADFEGLPGVKYFPKS